MILLIDVGNTHTHFALANPKRIFKKTDRTTSRWTSRSLTTDLRSLLGSQPPEGAAFCSVVPQATPKLWRALRSLGRFPILELTPKTAAGIGIRYPHPETIGPDRLANAVAARQHFGAPVVVVDFGTAVTFDVVDRNGHYVGGIIAPGLSAMTDYLHEKTALLPKIQIRETGRVIGKNTEQAMLIGAVHGYRGLIRELILELKLELNAPDLRVVATGGYARLLAAKLPEIQQVDPQLTLEGLRLSYQHYFPRRSAPPLA